MAKKQSEYTLSDVIRLRPKWILKKQDVELEHLYNTNLEFLSGMMSSSRTDIATYPYLSLFPDGKLCDKTIQDINKALFEYGELSKPRAIKQKANLNMLSIRKGYLSGALKQSSHNLTSQLERYQSRKERKLRSAKDYEERAERALRDYRQAEDQRKQYMAQYAEYEELEATQMEKIEAFTGGLDRNKIAVLKAIPKNYRIVELGPQSFAVVNVTPIILTETNAAAGINRTLNMGHYKFRFGYDMNYVGIRHFADNIVTQGSAHPHVSSYICWGNLGNLAGRALDDKDYETWWKLFETLLANYNSGSPFEAWGSYVSGKNSHYEAVQAFNKDTFDVLTEIYYNTSSSKFKEAYVKKAYQTPRPTRTPAEINLKKNRMSFDQAASALRYGMGSIPNSTVAAPRPPVTIATQDTDEDWDFDL